MTHAPLPHTAAIGAPTGFIGALRSLHPAALPFLAAVVVFSSVALANAPVARWLDNSAQAAQQGPVPASTGTAESLVPSADEGITKARVKPRCDICGIVEAIRRIEPVGELPAIYEFTVRMRDGSIRVSSNAGQAKWLAGDAIMLIGGVSSAGQ